MKKPHPNPLQKERELLFQLFAFFKMFLYLQPLTKKEREI